MVIETPWAEYLKSDLGSQGIYRIDDFPLCVVQAMIEYLYKGDYETPVESAMSDLTHDPEDYFPFYEEMYAIGNKYAICGLEAQTTAKYYKYFEKLGNNSKVLASLARIYLSDDEKKSCLCGIIDDEMWLRIRYTFQHPSPALRKLINCPAFAVAFLNSVYDSGPVVDFCVCCNGLDGAFVYDGKLECSNCGVPYNSD
ncbi:hypothetical protein E4U55_003493 [Claviceps digitariae]|nr:hypothetical protein E4U55_003493 [Claviceps digitariae]